MTQINSESINWIGDVGLNLNYGIRIWYVSE